MAKAFKVLPHLLAIAVLGNCGVHKFAAHETIEAAQEKDSTPKPPVEKKDEVKVPDENGAAPLNDPPIPSETLNTTVVDAKKIEDLCAKGEHIKKTQTIVYDEVAPACPFGMGDNNPGKSSQISARVDQKSALTIPPGTILCTIKLSVQEQSVRYDDHFILHMNKAVLATSFHGIATKFQKVNDLPVYDWNSIKGYEWPNNKDDQTPGFCLGRTVGDTANCLIPQTEENDPFKITFPQDMILKLSEKAYKDGKAEFTSTWVGDNDPDKDCSHSKISFVVDYEVVAKR